MYMGLFSNWQQLYKFLLFKHSYNHFRKILDLAAE